METVDFRRARSKENGTSIGFFIRYDGLFARCKSRTFSLSQMNASLNCQHLKWKPSGVFSTRVGFSWKMMALRNRSRRWFAGVLHGSVRNLNGICWNRPKQALIFNFPDRKGLHTERCKKNINKHRRRSLIGNWFLSNCVIW